jgi:DNA-binding NtrC family response regulator
MISYSIFIVDDEATIREGIVMALGSIYQMEGFSNAEDALSAMKKRAPDLVLLDVGLPGMDGIAALKEIKHSHTAMPVIMITAYEDIETVVSTMKLGAYDYIVKPIHMDELEVTVRNALDTTRLRKEVHLLQERYLKENIPCFIGESNAIQDVFEFIGRVAKSPDTPILILGETGTGKELIASAIHYRSPNFKGPFRTVNCAAIPKDLIESELFGYEKGAFSGAVSSGKNGLIEAAADGTLFLDEVGDLNPDAQAKLLRFLESGEFYRVGSTKKRHIRTRVVSATNKNLDDLIKRDLFRKDLYFRISVVKVEVPALNDRPEDIVAMAKHFLYVYSQKFGKAFTGLSHQTEFALSAHRWAGNVRELKNMIERGVLVGQGPKLTPQDL